MKIGQIVISCAGRDKESLLVVVGYEKDRILVVDGKHRPLERPKLKNQKHLKKTGVCLKQEEYRTNKAIKASMYRIRQEKMNSERGHLNV